MNEIRRLDGELIAADGSKTTAQLCQENKHNLSGSDLRGSNLSGSNLSGSNLSGSNLSGSNLSGSNLSGSDLSWSDLRGSDLRGSNLSGSDLSWSDLRGSDLRGSNIKFYQFPSTRLISSFPLGDLSDELTLELMRRDAYAHPYPERFDGWAKGGPCPYDNEERLWYFSEKRGLWKPGNPEMRDSDLITAICKEKGWGLP